MTLNLVVVWKLFDFFASRIYELKPFCDARKFYEEFGFLHPLFHLENYIAFVIYAHDICLHDTSFTPVPAEKLVLIKVFHSPADSVVE